MALSDYQTLYAVIYLWVIFYILNFLHLHCLQEGV